MGKATIIRRQLVLKQSAFMRAAYLVNYMNEYKYNMDEKSKKLLDVYADISRGLPLPSGRWGNAIALALEINNYVAAEYLIENAERLRLETNTVVSELGGINAWSLKDEYLYSQLTYEEIKLPKREWETDDDYKKYVESVIRNKEANERLEKKLSITNEDKELLTR